MPRDPKIINDLIRACSPTDLGRQIGVSESFVHYIMNGLRRPGVETSEAIARVLRVETGDVIEWSNTVRLIAARAGRNGFRCGRSETSLKKIWDAAVKSNKMDEKAKGRHK